MRSVRDRKQTNNVAVNLYSNQNRVEGLTQGLVRLGGKEKWQLAAPAADLLLLVRPGQGCCSYRPGRGCCYSFLAAARRAWSRHLLLATGSLGLGFDRY